MRKCNFPRSISIKMRVLHPSGPRWQTWKVCKDCGKEILIDRDRAERGLKPRYDWHSIYYKDPKRRPVIEIGQSQELLIDLL